MNNDCCLSFCFWIDTLLEFSFVHKGTDIPGLTGEFQESDEEEEDDIMNDELLNDEDLLNESELEDIDDGSDPCGMLFWVV